MNNDIRIKLAEFVGEIVKVRRSLPYPNGLGWKSPQGDIRPIPDPRNSADDCEALIRKLRECGYIVKVTWTDLPGIGEDSCLELWKVGRAKDGPLSFFFQATGDYKHGVCDFAEKIIEQQENGDGND